MVDKWDPEYMRSELPKEIKQELVDQGRDPAVKPTHRWLRENGFSYFLVRIREFGDKPDRWLIDECGFKKRRKDWPCTQKKTIDQVEQWLTYEDEVGERINRTSIGSARTHLRKSMEIAGEYIGTSDILELGRGEPVVCAQRVKQIMRGFGETFDNSQTRYNYVTTLRDFIAQMAADDVIEHDKLTKRVKKCGWGGNNGSMVISPSTSTVKAYFDACETRTEQLIILCLAGIGLRPSDICDPEAIEKIHLNAQTSCIEFTGQRKNGVGLVPIVVGEDFIRDFIRLVSLTPGDNNALLPSTDSKSGSRSTEWLRSRVAEIGERVDATLPNGEKLRPKHFRRFWFTTFSKAFTSYLRNADTVASMQGSSSGRISANHYFDEKETWFNEFERVAKLELSEPFCDFEPANSIGRIDVGDVTVDDLEKNFSVRETIGQVTLDGWKNVKTALPVGIFAYPASLSWVATSHLAFGWYKTKRRGILLDPDCILYSDLSIQRKSALWATAVLMFVIAVHILASNGTLTQLATGNLVESIPVVISMLYFCWLTDYVFPDPRDVLQDNTHGLDRLISLRGVFFKD